MATSKKKRKSPASSAKDPGGRASPEAIEKRRVARELNSLIAGDAPKVDGRTERRRKRLLKELRKPEEGLKPIERVQKASELLELGETFASLRKQGAVVVKTEDTKELWALVKRAQVAYEFAPEAWRILGLKVTAKGDPRKG